MQTLKFESRKAFKDFRNNLAQQIIVAKAKARQSAYTIEERTVQAQAQSELSALRYRFRCYHIAYCVLRGTAREKIEHHVHSTYYMFEYDVKDVINYNEELFRHEAVCVVAE
jgi:hypothetical protein